jgi:hypothetical protein
LKAGITASVVTQHWGISALSSSNNGLRLNFVSVFSGQGQILVLPETSV